MGHSLFSPSPASELIIPSQAVHVRSGQVRIVKCYGWEAAVVGWEKKMGT